MSFFNTSINTDSIEFGSIYIKYGYADSESQNIFIELGFRNYCSIKFCSFFDSRRMLVLSSYGRVLRLYRFRAKSLGYLHFLNFNDYCNHYGVTAGIVNSYEIFYYILR